MDYILEELSRLGESKRFREDSLFGELRSDIKNIVRVKEGWIKVGDVVKELRGYWEIRLGDYRKVYNYCRNVLLKGVSDLVVVKKMNGGIFRICSVDWFVKKYFKGDYNKMYEYVKIWNKKVRGIRLLKEINKISKKIEENGNKMSEEGLENVREYCIKLIDELIGILNELDKVDSDIVLNEKIRGIGEYIIV